jgi:hypothetical protein
MFETLADRWLDREFVLPSFTLFRTNMKSVLDLQAFAQLSRQRMRIQFKVNFLVSCKESRADRVRLISLSSKCSSGDEQAKGDGYRKPSMFGIVKPFGHGICK